MYPFKYHRVKTVRQAAGLLAKHEDAKLLAGGQTLLPTMKNRLASPSILVDLNTLDDLVGVEAKRGSLVIKAMTRHFDVANNADILASLPGLANLAANIGDPAVRHRGTIGGSVANNDPAADYPAGCLALGATIVTNRRKIAAEEFFTGLFSTALEEGEIITRIAFPTGARFAYAKFPNPASRYAAVGVGIAKRGKSVRVAVTGSGESGVFRWEAAEQALSEKFSLKALEGLSHPAEGLIGDIHATPEYRAHLIGVMARRAISTLTAR